nr:AMP-binding protein [Brevundimonas sp.]
MASRTVELPGSPDPDVYPVAPEWAARAHLDAAAYESARTAARVSPDAFWAEQARCLDWMTAPTSIRDVSFNKADFRIRWFGDGILNVAYNCLDRHLAGRGDETAILWEGDEPTQSGGLTYRELHAEVCRMANVLKGLGVVKGDRVTLYLPMIPAAAVAMLACARIGAVHSVVFGGFSPDSLAGRIEDCGSKIIITADEGLRGGKRVPLKANVDAACDKLPAGSEVDHVLVVSHTNADIPIVEGRDVRYGEAKHGVSADCPCEPMNAEDPLFILYTSGSTGKPKGVLHTTGGYLFWAAWTHELVFDYRPGEVFWCTADVGWVTGHSYCVYG